MSTADTCDNSSPTLAGDVPAPVVVPETFFAPAGRRTRDECLADGERIDATPFFQQALDTVPNAVMVLNDKRQIVAANRPLLSQLKVRLGDVVEKRPGEALGCVHAADGPDGCGTAAHCATCGAAAAILESQATGAAVVRECRLTVDASDGEASRDLRVTAAPASLGGRQFVVATVEDTSHAKRLAVLERTFFHDILNTVGCIQGYARFLAEEETGFPEIATRLALLSDQLVEEIQSHRDLRHAEAGELTLQPALMNVAQAMEDLRSRYAHHPAAQEREIDVGEFLRGTIMTDSALCMRVLGNMVKNALEATDSGGRVTLACADLGTHVRFTVHNREVIPEEVQLQIFERSFSTKGEPGRGIGTYSMKLLGERYLGGRVDFHSRLGQGTTFRLTLPKDGPASHAEMPESEKTPVRPATPAQRRQWLRFLPETPHVWVIVDEQPRPATTLNESFGGIGLALEWGDAKTLAVGMQVQVMHCGEPAAGVVQWIEPNTETGQVHVGIRWLNEAQK